MSNWAGFSEEDVLQLQSGESSKRTRGSRLMNSKEGNLMGGKARPQHAVQPMKQYGTHDTTIRTDVPPAALFSPSKPTAEPVKKMEASTSRHPPTAVPQQQAVNQAPKALHSSSDLHMPPKPTLTVDSEKKAASTAPSSSPISDVKGSVLLDESDGRNRDLSMLQHYQQQQKMMEELNKKKKQMLAEALSERQKQATVEAHKLNAIRKELSLLDQMLTADVSVIRDRIEEATRDYAEASKRYEQAEKEFIASKVNLHKKGDMKEQLTEHLYTIIHQNEIRKAKKLADLMEKLDLATTKNGETSPTPVVEIPDLPSLSLLGSMQTVGSGNLVQHSLSQEGEKSPPPADAPSLTNSGLDEAKPDEPTPVTEEALPPSETEPAPISTEASEDSK
ncbi:RAB6-interacting golgin-like isoform X2 [Watersipora subatra]|uniref:RAB6-interacting golgin-like isoform X2 n=1 Tax=Watersipora subatra TaxID=2589382 RepID=UPI00355BA0AB